MENLKEIVNLINRRRISKIELYDKTLLSNKESKFTRLYEAIENGTINTDKEAVLFLYGSITSTNEASYRQLKSRFTKRLFNTLHFLDLNSTAKKNDPYHQAYFECHQALNSARILVKFGGRMAAIKLIRLKYSKALKYKLYDVLKDFSFILIETYGLTGSFTKLKDEKERLEFYLKNYNYELKSKTIIADLQSRLARKAKPSKELIEYMGKSVQKLDMINEDADSFETNYCCVKSKVLYYEITGNFEKLLEVSSQYEEYLINQPLYSNSTRFAVTALWKMKASLHAKKYKEGLQTAKNNEKYFLKSAFNWFVAKELEFKLALHDGNIELAQSLYDQVIKDRGFKLLTENVKEKWKIYEAFLEFLFRYKNPDERKEKFRLGRFYNEVPIYMQDKSGFNFSIIVLFRCFHLIHGDFGLYIDSMDALKLYRSRHLKHRTLKRSNVFAKMLLQIEKLNFDVELISEKVTKDLEYLNSDQNRVNINEWEIIDYEDLWEILINILKKYN